MIKSIRTNSLIISRSHSRLRKRRESLGLSSCSFRIQNRYVRTKLPEQWKKSTKRTPNLRSWSHLYDSSTCQLNVMKFWEDGDKDFHLVDMVKYQAKPFVIYTSTKSEESFVAALQSSDGLAEAPTVKLVKSSLFSYEQAMHRLMYLRVTGMEEGLNIKERVSFVS